MDTKTAAAFIDDLRAERDKALSLIEANTAGLSELHEAAQATDYVLTNKFSAPQDIVAVVWATVTRWAGCPLCDDHFRSYNGPVVALRDGGEWRPLCDECATKYTGGPALLAIRDRFNESLVDDPRDLDNVGRPLNGGAVNRF